jgi:hypothetical protein
MDGRFEAILGLAIPAMLGVSASGRARTGFPVLLYPDFHYFSSFSTSIFVSLQSLVYTGSKVRCSVSLCWCFRLPCEVARNGAAPTPIPNPETHQTFMRLIAGLGDGSFRDHHDVSRFVLWRGGVLPLFSIPIVFLSLHGESDSGPVLRPVQRASRFYVSEYQSSFGARRRAFVFCSPLASICIPSSVTQIGRECFFKCSTIATTTVGVSPRVSVGRQFAFPECSPALCLPSLLIGPRFFFSHV